MHPPFGNGDKSFNYFCEWSETQNSVEVVADGISSTSKKSNMNILWCFPSELAVWIVIDLDEKEMREYSQ